MCQGAHLLTVLCPGTAAPQTLASQQHQAAWCHIASPVKPAADVDAQGSANERCVLLTSAGFILGRLPLTMVNEGPQEIQAAEAMAAEQAEEVRRLQGELQEARRNGS